MATLRYGSRGDEVKNLQNALNQAGYQLDVDGQYGQKTQAAVRDYQSKNGLAVDGVAGDNTWAALNKQSASAQAQTNTQVTSPAAQEPARAPQLTGVSDYTHERISGLENGYQPSARVLQAQAYLDQAQRNPVAEYQSQYDDQINAAYQRIVGREPFNYNLNGDMLYQQYKQQAIENGRLAMMDTMGQAAALNGGYGSSYGQAVGQQQYNEYLRNLNDIVPDLYNAAYQRWQGEGDELMQRYSMLRDQENQDYNRWNDQYNRQQAELDRAQRNYESERDFDYNSQLTEREYWQGRAALEQDDYWKNLAAQAQAAGSGRSGGGGGSGSKGKKPTNAMWEAAANAKYPAEMQALSEEWERKGYDPTEIYEYWDQNGYGNLTTREDSAGGKPSDSLKKGLGIIETEGSEIYNWMQNPGESLSYNQLLAEQAAAQENRRLINYNDYVKFLEEQRKKNNASR